MESDEWVTGCWTQRTSITKGDDTVYNILRMHYALEEPEDLKFDISKLQPMSTVKIEIPIIVVCSRNKATLAEF